MVKSKISKSVTKKKKAKEQSTFSFLIKQFCCPPCPSRIIAKMAYHPPKPPNYMVVNNPTGRLMLQIEKDIFDADPTILEKKVDVFYAKSKNSNQIVCVNFRLWEDPKFVILYSNTNAADLGNMAELHIYLANRLHCNIFTYDYSGYGNSSGVPSEVNQLLDSEAAFDHLHKIYSLTPDRIILYGQSIGSVPTIHLATKHKVAGVVLDSGLLSGIRLLCGPKMSATIGCFPCLNPFANIKKVNKIESPVLMIHGKADKTIPFEHALEVHRWCKNAVPPLWIEEGGHNNLFLFPVYFKRLEQFVNVDLIPEAADLSTQTLDQSKSTNSPLAKSLVPKRMSQFDQSILDESQQCSPMSPSTIITTTFAVKSTTSGLEVNYLDV